MRSGDRQRQIGGEPAACSLEQRIIFDHGRVCPELAGRRQVLQILPKRLLWRGGMQQTPQARWARTATATGDIWRREASRSFGAVLAGCDQDGGGRLVHSAQSTLRAMERSMASLARYDERGGE